MVEKSVFPLGHEPGFTKRKQPEGSSLYANQGAGRHRGTALTEEQRMRELKAKGVRKDGGPGLEGETEIADPRIERGIQHGYGKNQDEVQEKKTAQRRAQGAAQGVVKARSFKDGF